MHEPNGFQYFAYILTRHAPEKFGAVSRQVQHLAGVEEMEVIDSTACRVFTAFRISCRATDDGDRFMKQLGTLYSTELIAHGTMELTGDNLRAYSAALGHMVAAIALNEEEDLQDGLQEAVLEDLGRKSHSFAFSKVRDLTV